MHDIGRIHIGVVIIIVRQERKLHGLVRTPLASTECTAVLNLCTLLPAPYPKALSMSGTEYFRIEVRAVRTEQYMCPHH